MNEKTLEQKLRDTIAFYKAEFVGVNPDWQPLHKVIPPEWWGGWMFMQGGLGPNKNIICYKHGITRKSLHIDTEGRCWNYHCVDLGRPGEYTPADSIEAVMRVYKDIEKMNATPCTVYDANYRQKRDAALAAAGFTVIS